MDKSKETFPCSFMASVALTEINHTSSLNDNKHQHIFWDSTNQPYQAHWIKVTVTWKS